MLQLATSKQAADENSRVRRVVEPNDAPAQARHLPPLLSSALHKPAYFGRPMSGQNAEPASERGAIQAGSEVIHPGDDSPAPRRSSMRRLVLAMLFALGTISGLSFLRAIEEKSTVTEPVTVARPDQLFTAEIVPFEQDVRADFISVAAPQSASALPVPNAASTPVSRPEQAPAGDTFRPSPTVAAADARTPGLDLPVPAVSISAPGNPAVEALSSRSAVSVPIDPVVANARLLERGDALFGLGDLSSARLFYERAARAGDAQAALRLGETYDPAFLVRIRFMGASGNASVAAYWYQRASELGAPDARMLLEAISAENSHTAP